MDKAANRRAMTLNFCVKGSCVGSQAAVTLDKIDDRMLELRPTIDADVHCDEQRA